MAAVAAPPGTATGPGLTWRNDGQDVPLSDTLKGNQQLFSPEEQQLLVMLLEEGQEHLLAAWPAPGEHDNDKRKLVRQIAGLDRHYHGGLRAYIRNAKKLLAESKEGINAFDGFTPSVPHGETLDLGSEHFIELENAGLAEAGHSAFVLVAGGLGERLGYSGIKLSLPAELATGRCFLQLYIEHILALQARAHGPRLPLAIMTSDDTHERTVKLLEQHHYFGMSAKQVTLIKQEKVACLTDNEAHIALDPEDPYSIQTKPHGHGDVHALLHSSGLAAQWAEQGFKWVCFFQDTNALVFRALLVALGVSAKHDYDMNSLAVPRKAKEQIGAIARLSHADGTSLTINVEYNQLDPLLRSTINKEGDVNDPQTGYSPFPGNINQLVLKLSTYVEQLQATGGVISEFVNPKYKDATKTAFKSSTRLECMMQDFPKALPASAKVGFTVLNQVWATYSPVKNSAADARAKAAEGNPTHSATTGELDIYKSNCMLLKQVVGAVLPEPSPATFNGIPCEEYPHVVLSPSFACTLTELKSKIVSGSLSLAPKSTLVLDGQHITIDGLQVKGTFVLQAGPGAHVAVRGLKVDNQGWEWAALPEDSVSEAEELRIRGFKVQRKAASKFMYGQEGHFTLPEPASTGHEVYGVDPFYGGQGKGDGGSGAGGSGGHDPAAAIGVAEAIAAVSSMGL